MGAKPEAGRVRLAAVIAVGAQGSSVYWRTCCEDCHSLLHDDACETICTGRCAFGYLHLVLEVVQVESCLCSATEATCRGVSSSEFGLGGFGSMLYNRECPV